MKNWAKFEDKINSLLSRFIERMSSKFKKSKKNKTSLPLTPQPKASRKEVLVQKFKQINSSIKEKIKPISTSTQQLSNKIKSFNIKNANSKIFFASVAGVLASLAIKLKAWYIGLRPESVLIFTVSTTVVSLASINIYKASKDVMQESTHEAQELAEKVENATAPSRRPAYYKNEQRQFTVQEITFPVIIEGSTGVKTLMLDVEIQSSNRYVKEYLYKNEHLVKDVLNKRLKPIIPNFPLEEEGKSIIRDKIKTEIDSLLERLEIKGHIEKVMIVNIIAA